MKKFWQECRAVKIPPSDPLQQKVTYGVAFDGKLLKLPSGEELKLTSQVLAEALAAEWQKAAKEDKKEFSSADLPLTGIISTAYSLTGDGRQALIEELAAYAKTDLLYYFAETPEALYQQQQQDWLPQIKQFEAKLGNSVKVRIGRGIVYLEQDPQIYVFARRFLTDCTNSELAALRCLIKNTGSFILGTAVAESRLTVEKAFNLSLTDEFFQERLFGADPETEQKRAKTLRDSEQAVFFLSTCSKVR